VEEQHKPACTTDETRDETKEEQMSEPGDAADHIYVCYQSLSFNLNEKYRHAIKSFCLNLLKYNHRKESLSELCVQIR